MNACAYCQLVITNKRNKKFCNVNCYEKSGHRSKTQFIDGHEPVREQNGSKNSMWKGSNVGYSGIHAWVRRKLGNPKLCEDCGENKKQRYEWANVSGEYKRDLSDWKRLCCKCHFRFDKKALGGDNRKRTIGVQSYWE